MQIGWYKQTQARIDVLRQNLLPRDVKEYQLDKLERIAMRVDRFAASDAECLKFKNEIDNMLAMLPGAPLSNAQNKTYVCMVGQMVGHLKKAHGLINEGENLGLWLIIGLVAGGVVGLALGSGTAIPTATGIAAGFAIGLYLDLKARRQGKTL
jgi:hypothetical protein